MTAPVRASQFKTAKFAAYLAQQGAEIGKPTNAYEVIRYRAFWDGSTAAVTHIVYTKDNGLLTYTKGSRDHYEAFMADEALPEVAPTLDEKRVTRMRSQRKGDVRAKLRDRDGDCCWYCGGSMTSFDSNIEHLINISDGGTNALANLVLTHTDCNTKAGNMPLAKKLELRAQLRSEPPVALPTSPTPEVSTASAFEAGAAGQRGEG